jgi:hypothetical protein
MINHVLPLEELPIFQREWTILYSHQQYRGLQLSTSLLTSAIIDSDYRILVGVKRHLIVVSNAFL